MLLERPARRVAPPSKPAGDPLNMGRPVSLGERRFLARGGNKDLLERLLLDPEPLVINNLLRNPALTEDWVLRIATRRPIRGAVLLEVARHPRWSARYHVRLALARNPYSPTELAVRMVPELQTTDLREIAMDGTLHEDVCAAAKRELDRRRGLGRGGVLAVDGVGDGLGDGSILSRRGRGVPVDGLGRGGGDVDLALAGDGPLEVADPLAEGVTDLGDPPGAEDDEHDQQDEEELGGTGHSKLRDGPIARAGLEDQHQDLEDGAEDGDG